jgi:uncharacterized protein YeaO (DUF488 family)
VIKLKRVYETPSGDDGRRLLVERLWPRGIKKEKAGVDEWVKEIAPSTDLRKWYNHDVEKWPEFKRRYIDELKQQTEQIEEIRKQAKGKTVTFVYAAHDTEHNSAVVLKEYIESRKK